MKAITKSVLGKIFHISRKGVEESYNHFDLLQIKL